MRFSLPGILDSFGERPGAARSPTGVGPGPRKVADSLPDVGRAVNVGRTGARRPPSPRSGRTVVPAWRLPECRRCPSWIHIIPAPTRSQVSQHLARWATPREAARPTDRRHDRLGRAARLRAVHRKGRSRAEACSP